MASMHEIEKPNVLRVAKSLPHKMNNDPTKEGSNKKRKKRILNPATNREMIDDGIQSENQTLLCLIIQLF